MGYPTYEARKLEAAPYDHVAYAAGFREGYDYGYAEAVEESYPEVWTACSAHRVFDSKCKQCVWDG